MSRILSPRHSRHSSTGVAKRLSSAFNAPRQVRIVAGRWKRTLLPVVDHPGLRPTPDRVRETLFNWLGQTLDGQVVLDLFAGTGALGIEAASRGAQRVTLVESNPQVWRALMATRERLEGACARLEIVRDDAHRWLAQARVDGRQFDLILLDPPFDDDHRLPLLMARVGGLLTESGRVYVETPTPWVDHVNWEVLHRARAGQVHYHLLTVARAPHASLSAAPTAPGTP